MPRLTCPVGVDYHYTAFCWKYKSGYCDFVKIARVHYDIAITIFKLESEGLRALSSINKLASKASQQQSRN